MKIILSRKGFDSSYGGKPSPIFPDGSMCSLPIPEGQRGHQATCYNDIRFGELSIGHLIQDLTNGHVTGDLRVHLDPDLNPDSLPRPAHWRPVFGQASAAEGHLRNQGITAGDVFLFFGWFKAVEWVGDRYRYVAKAPDLHVLFGWLQVESRVEVETATDLPDWLNDHPHLCNRDVYAQNVVYLSSQSLTIQSRSLDLPGAGLFQRFSPALQLTAPKTNTRGLWELPRWFHPDGRLSTLTYHSKPERWQLANHAVRLRSVCQGQEFVLNCDHYPESIDWLTTLFKKTAQAESLTNS